MVRLIDLHNHLVTPEVVAFLEREGAHYHTRLAERAGQRFFVIQETAWRPLHARISPTDSTLLLNKYTNHGYPTRGSTPITSRVSTAHDDSCQKGLECKMECWRDTPR